MKEQFNIPIVLLIFKRKDKLTQIISRVSQVKPKKIYIIADGPRDDSEKEAVLECRSWLESLIDWDCEVIRNYADTNRGVYENIGEGAKWVFQREETAIFLEDDNLPEVDFFRFSQEMLEKYKNEPKVLWVCGTNYLENSTPSDGASYVFTKHLMPCGWASWSDKFLKHYDGHVSLLDEPAVVDRLESQYDNKALYKQQIELSLMERKRILTGKKPSSWDYQMEFSVRVNGLYGISPKNNLIENIGVDEHSIHGGNTMNNPMVKRFCSIKSYGLEFPLVHPVAILPDTLYEKRVGKIILQPYWFRAKKDLIGSFRNKLSMPDNVSTKKFLVDKFLKKK